MFQNLKKRGSAHEIALWNFLLTIYLLIALYLGFFVALKHIYT